MSYGDEIMACGQALSLARETGKRVRIVDARGKRRWDDLWRNIPEILHPRERVIDYAVLRNGVGARPYLDYTNWDGIRATHTGWRAQDHIGRIVFDESEIEFAEKACRGFGPFVLIEPNIAKASATVRWDSNPNKQWGRSRWQELVRLVKLPAVQVGAKGTEVLDGVYFIPTESFRLGAAVLQRAALSILPEGGLHHAAAALGRRAVVLFGGVISPSTTGYPFHINITRGEPCRMLVPCKHCEQTWQTISPEEVAGHASSLLASSPGQSRV